MPEVQTKNYLLVKTLQPAGAFADEMHARDERIIDSDVLLSEPGTIIEKVELTEDEAADRASDARPHILSVEVEQTASHPTPVTSQGAENMSPEAVKRYLGVDKAHAAGKRGAGQKSAVVDSGSGTAWAQKYAASIIDKRSYISGETWESPDDTHGEWCAAAVLLLSPDAKVGIFKALSGQSGSGSYSGIIAAINDAVQLGYTGITLSLGGPKSAAVNAAVNAAEDKGVHVTSAAGNEQRGKTGMTADETSPASAEKGMTCASGRSDGTTSDYSNWGNCVRIKGPGENVQVPDVPGFWDGTSMITPYIQGLLNILRSAGATKDAAKTALYATAADTAEPAYKEGHGNANVDRALAKLSPAPTEPPAGRFDLSISAFCETDTRTLLGKRGRIKSRYGGGWDMEPIK